MHRLPARTSYEISVLLVMSPDRRQQLVEHLQGCRAEVLPVSDCQEASRILQAETRLRVVLTDVVLRDGDWRSLVKEVSRNHPNAHTIVCARLADPDLWMDVLAGGAYDLLVEPYEREEVRRIVRGAAAANGMRSQALAS